MLKEKSNNQKNKIFFDTLAYSRQLEFAGVRNADLCTKALNDALLQNLYSKHEVDTMIEAALNRVNASLGRFDERIKELKQESITDRIVLEKAMEKSHSTLEKAISETRVTLEKAMAEDRVKLEKTMAEDRLTFEKARTEDRVTFEKAMEKDRLTHQNEISNVTDKLNNAVERLNEKIMETSQRLNEKIMETSQRLNEKIMETSHRTMKLLGTLIVLMGAVSTFAQHFI
jgi:hypothetical protein